jgi:hypothetical protein
MEREKTAKALVACPFILLFSPRLCARDVFITTVCVAKSGGGGRDTSEKYASYFIIIIIYNDYIIRSGFFPCTRKHLMLVVVCPARIYLYSNTHTRRRD